MTTPQHIAVIDIGKTNAKLALVDLPTLTELDVITRPNHVLPGPPWPHFDTEGVWAFLLDGLKRFHERHRIDAISTTTHGASIVLLDAAGKLVAPVLDYEHDGPATCAAAYDSIRPPFEQTGSPRLTNGLNVGAQLHWQFQADPTLHARTAHILTYPQYWTHRLTGEIASDVTSMGCHTDLWAPQQGRLSDLIDTLKIGDKIAPVRKSTDIPGPILPEIAAATGLPPDTPVACGIHDSNASLYPHILSQQGTFSVVSTGTWVIVMTIGGRQVTLDPARDTLMNVNARGEAVPSARFMGGREFELIQQGRPIKITSADVASVLADNLMLLPAVEPATGPFQGNQMRWSGGAEPDPGSGRRAVTLSWYLALMTSTCLDLTGAAGSTIVEGPFAQNPWYLSMLAAATGRRVRASRSATGTSIGAALLFGGTDALAHPDKVAAAPNAAALIDYAGKWRSMLGR